jgi:hypothetical protein
MLRVTQFLHRVSGDAERSGVVTTAPVLPRLSAAINLLGTPTRVSEMGVMLDSYWRVVGNE